MSWSNAIGVHLAHLRSDLREFIGLLNFLKAEYPVGDIYFFIPAANENAGRTLQVLERLAG